MKVRARVFCNPNRVGDDGKERKGKKQGLPCWQNRCSIEFSFPAGAIGEEDPEDGALQAELWA